MDKKIGKIFLFFLLFISTAGLISAKITVRVTDGQGYELEEVGAGQPFTVEVTISDTGSQSSAPTVQGDSRIKLYNSGTYFSSINGKNSAKYSYQGRIDEPGEYQLGPVTVVHDGQSQESSSVKQIVVGTSQKTINKQQKKDGEDILFELHVDKKHLFVGESTQATLTFYYADDTVSLKNILPPTIEGFVLRGDMQKYTQGQVKIKGTLYNYVRWEWQLSPTKTGTLIVPAYGAEYERLALHSNNRFGLELFFAGRMNERIRTYSNALSISVDPLPSYNGFVTAVGRFKQVVATIAPSTAQEGEAVVFALEFEGDGDLESIQTPQLRGMPEGLKYYDSKNYIIPPQHKDQRAQKRFEYIVQGLRAGTWQIPAQEFVVFDVEKKAYKTLKTKPVAVTIVANQAVQKTAPSPDNAQESASSEQTAFDELSPIDENGLWYPVPVTTPLPTWLFVLLSLLPCVYMAALGVWRLLKKRVASHQLAQRSTKAFSIARVSLEQAKQNHDASHIYGILVQLMADRFSIDSKEVTQDLIEKKLQDAGLSSFDRLQWHEFFTQVAEYTYGQNVMDGIHLFDQAHKWINTLESVL